MLKISLILGRFDELPGGDQSQATEVARMAEDAGLHALTLGDHLLLGDRLDRYPYGSGFRHPEGQRTSYLEPVAVMAAFAAVTSRIRISTSILLAPLRPAVLLAKQLASIDVLSGGRCEPAFGYGWQPEEYEAVGLDWTDRYRVMRDNVAACRALWGDQPASFESETVSFDGVYSMPRPIQERIPILLGVKPTPRNLALMAEHCDGWDPVSSYTPAELGAGVSSIREAFSAAGRDPDDAIIRGHLLAVRDGNRIDLDRSFDAAGPLLERGANQLAFQIPVGYGEMFATMGELGRFISEIGTYADKY